MKTMVSILVLAISLFARAVVWRPTVNNPVCTATGQQFTPAIVSGDAGVAIIARIDKRNGLGNWDIYAQRIGASGAVQSTANGLAISTAINGQLNPMIVDDGSGGSNSYVGRRSGWRKVANRD